MIVHDFGHADDAGPGQHGGYVFRGEARSGRFRPVYGRHAGRNADVYGKGQIGAAVEHVAHAGPSQHVADFVRVDNGRRGAARQHPGGVRGRGDHGAFDVQMGIDEAGGQPLAGRVDGLPGAQIVGSGRPYDRDAVAVYADVRGIDFACQDVDETDVAEGQIQRSGSAGRFDQFRSGGHGACRFFLSLAGFRVAMYTDERQTGVCRLPVRRLGSHLGRRAPRRKPARTVPSARADRQRRTALCIALWISARGSACSA